MNSMESLAEVDTNTLEAALEAAISGIPVSEESPMNDNEPVVTDEQTDSEVGSENEQADDVGNDETAPEVDAELDASQEPEVDAEIEEETEDAVIHRHWAEDEKLAAQIRDNNPDIPLETALALARARLGYNTAESANQPTEPESQEPSRAEKILALEQKMDEAGANEGLFTPEIAEMLKQHARLIGEQSMVDAVNKIETENYQRREQEIADKESARLTSLMQESVQRVYAMSPEAESRNSLIGQAIERQIEIWTAENSADLHKPNTPELVYWAAQSLLPPESRVSAVPREQPKHTQPAQVVKQAQVQKTSEAAMIPTAPPVSTVRALPVSATARTAQPDSINLNPSQVGQLVKDASKDDLAAIEEAIYGVSGRDVLLRI